jgi:Spy/CpxP family protein refolding chaperone
MRSFQRAAALLLAGGITLSLSLSAQAQRGQRGLQGERGGAASATLLQRLNLAADQQTKVKAAADTFRADIEKARAMTDPQARRQAMRQARQNYETALNAVLTPDQQRQLQSLREEARQYRAFGPIGARLAGLNLTDDQKTKIKAIAAKYQPETDKLRTALRNGDREQLRTQSRELRRKMRDEVMAVLTPEQQKQLNSEPTARAAN